MTYLSIGYIVLTTRSVLNLGGERNTPSAALSGGAEAILLRTVLERWRVVYSSHFGVEFWYSGERRGEIKKKKSTQNLQGFTKEFLVWNYYRNVQISQQLDALG